MNTFSVGDTFGSIIITKRTAKQIYFKSFNSILKETYKRILKDDNSENIIISESTLDFYGITKDDEFFKFAVGEVSTGTFTKGEMFYTLSAKAKEDFVESTRQIEMEVKTMENTEVLSVEYSRALSLNRKIKANAQILADVIFELGSQLKEMRDGKLYKELGYKNFEEYCKAEIGFTRVNAYKYIAVSEKLPEDFVNSSLQNLGIKKLELLAKLDEPQREQLIETVDIENTTVKQLQEEVKKLKSENQELQETVTSTNDMIITVQNANAVLKAQNSEQVKSLEEQIAQLEKQIQELESRPIDVAVEKDTTTDIEISNLRREIKAREESIKRLTKQYNQLEDDMTTATQNAYKQGLEAGKDSNGNQNDVFDMVTENFEDAFMKYFRVIRENKNPGNWAQKVKNTLRMFDDLRKDSLNE